MGQDAHDGTMCTCRMDDFNCPHCGGNMIDIEGCYICKDCDFID